MQLFVRSYLWPGVFCHTATDSLVAAQSSPVAPDTVDGCTTFIDYPDPFLPEQGATCESIAELWGITERAFIVWNPSVGSDCSNLIEGNSYCVEENFSTEPSNPDLPSATSSTTSRTSTTTSATGPSPTQSGLTRECRRFYFVESGDTCVGIVDKHGTFTLSQFYSWNPAVGSNCQGLQAGVHVCVGVQNTPTARPTTSRPATSAGPTSTATPNGPQPQQPNVRRDCQRFQQVVSGDSCEIIANRYRTFTVQQFISWNPDVGNACTSLWLDYYVCIGIPGTPTIMPTTVRPSATTPTAATGVVTPNPIQSGTISTCNRFSRSEPSGGTCGGYSRNRGMSLAQLYAWNRGLGVRGENCQARFANNMNYCIGVSAPLPPPNNGAVQAGVTNICWRYASAPSGDTCESFARRNRISTSQLYSWNSALGSNGANCHRNFWAGYWYCVQVAG